jgi:hypothetical protein
LQYPTTKNGFVKPSFGYFFYWLYGEISHHWGTTLPLLPPTETGFDREQHPLSSQICSFVGYPGLVFGAE